MDDVGYLSVLPAPGGSRPAGALRHHSARSARADRSGSARCGGIEVAPPGVDLKLEDGEEGLQRPRLVSLNGMAPIADRQVDGLAELAELAEPCPV
ncbi:MAG: hypothetical protein ACR2JY_20480 [Chloroflexota bacterium]